MKLTTLCYIEKDSKYLMLHRTKKENDQSFDKWLGVGGKFEKNEVPEECLLREVKEETGLILNSYLFRGVVTFISDIWETEYMFIYTSDDFTGQIKECNEGELVWIEKDKLNELNLWQGDKFFLQKLIDNEKGFSLKLVYEGEHLKSVTEF